MTQCSLCHSDTQEEYGPIRRPVCLSCWLEIGDNLIIECSDDLKQARLLVEEMQEDEQIGFRLAEVAVEKKYNEIMSGRGEQ